VTGLGGKFEILRESIDISGVVNVTIEGNKLTIKHDPKFVEEVLSKIKEQVFTPVGVRMSISKDFLLFQ